MGVHFIGVDVGTGSACAGVFDARGKPRGAAKRPITLWREFDEVVEQPCQQIWQAVCASVREAPEEAGLAAAVGVLMGFSLWVVAGCFLFGGNVGLLAGIPAALSSRRCYLRGPNKTGSLGIDRELRSDLGPNRALWLDDGRGLSQCRG